jgi:hypothetical protein
MVIRANRWKKSESARATWASLSKDLVKRSGRTGRASAAAVTKSEVAAELEHEGSLEPVPSRVRIRELIESLLPDPPEPPSDRFQVVRRPRMSWRTLRRH